MVYFLRRKIERDISILPSSDVTKLGIKLLPTSKQGEADVNRVQADGEAASAMTQKGDLAIVPSKFAVKDLKKNRNPFRWFGLVKDRQQNHYVRMHLYGQID